MRTFKRAVACVLAMMIVFSNLAIGISANAETYSDIAFTGLSDGISFSTARSQWDFYLVPSVSLPGTADSTSFSGLTISVNGVGKPLAFSHSSYNGTAFFTMNASDLPQTVSGNTTIIIKSGTAASSDGSGGINLTQDFTIYVNSYGFSTSGFITPNDTGAQLKLSTVAGGGDKNGLYLATNDGFTYKTDWSVRAQAATGFIDGVRYISDGGVYYNGTKTSAQLIRWDNGQAYVPLSDVSISAKSGDTVVVKGAFVLNGYIVDYAERTFVFDGTSWSVRTQDMALTGINAVSQYSSANSRWEVYLTPSATLPGTPDSTAYTGLTLTVNGSESSLSAYNCSYANTLFFVIPSTVLPGTLTENTTVTVSGTGTSNDGSPGIHLASAFTIYANQYGLSNTGFITAQNYSGTPSLDAGTASGGDAKGIYLNAADGMNAFGWDVAIPAVSGNDNGVFLNGVKTGAALKKYADGKYYVDLNGASVVPSDSDTVTIKGAFQYRNYTVNLAELTLVYTGTGWMTQPSVSDYTPFTLTGISAVTQFVSGHNQWEVYLTPSTLLPGVEDHTGYAFTVSVNGTDYTLTGWKSSYQNTLFFAIPAADLPGTLSGNTTVVVKATNSLSSDHKYGVSLTADYTIYANSHGWSDAGFITIPTPNETDVALSVDTATAGGGDGHGIYLNTPDSMPTAGWGVSIQPMSGKLGDVDYDSTCGIYYNSVKQSACALKKYANGKYYVGLADAGITAVDGDIVTIKGQFQYNGYIVAFREIFLYYNGQKWATTYTPPIPYTGFTVSGINGVTGYSTTNSRWEIYLNTNTLLPGAIDQYSFKTLTVTVDGQDVALTVYHTYQDTLLFVLDKSILPQSITKNTLITLKAGSAVNGDQTCGITLTADFNIYANQYGWSTTGYLTLPTPDETGAALSVDYNTASGGNGNGIYLNTTDSLTPDTTWVKRLQSVSFDKDSGLFYNGTKTTAKMVKYGDGKLYVALIDAGVSAQDHDCIIIKGLFTEDDYTVQYDTLTLYYNGQQWATTYTPPTQYTGFTVSGINGVTGYSATNSRWEIYLNTSTVLPGKIDQYSFKTMTADIDGQDVVLTVYHTYQDTLLFVLDKSILPQSITKNTLITLKAGSAVTDDKAYGITLTSDFKIYANQYGWSTTGYLSLPTPNETGATLSVDKDTAGGGNENGIYLKTTDSLTPDTTWVKRLQSVSFDQDSGVFYNGTKTEAKLAKYADGKMYVGLIDAGITAKDHDCITIKGLFTEDDYTIQYNTLTLYYNGQQWATAYTPPVVTQYTSFTVSGINSVTGYSTTNSRWEIYLNTSTLLPGAIDQYSFKTLTVNVDGQDVVLTVYHTYQDTLLFVLDKSILPQSITKNTLITLKAGSAVTDDKAYGITLTSDFKIYANQYGWSTTGYLTLPTPDETGAVLSVDKDTAGGGNENGIYFNTNDHFTTDTTWVTRIAAVGFDNDSGVFYNGTKTEAKLAKYANGKMYVGLLDAGITAKNKDSVVIKGLFSSNGHTVEYSTATFYYNGQTWDTTYHPPVTTAYTNISIKSINGVSSFSTVNNRWEIYLNTNGQLPGGIDKTSFKTLTVSVNGKNYDMTVFHSYQDTLLIIIDGSVLPKTITGNTKITLKAGSAKTADMVYGITLTSDFDLYINPYGWSTTGYLKPPTVAKTDVPLSVDYDTASGGDEKGIYLNTADSFPTDTTWQTRIPAVGYDTNSGVFYNGVKTGVKLARYADGKLYVGLIDAGITAKDKDSVTIKGTFALNGYGIQYRKLTLYYNGQMWDTSYHAPIKTAYTNISVKSVNSVTQYSEKNKRWEIYLNVDSMLPGKIDKMSFSSLTVDVNGHAVKTTVSHSYQHTLFFIIDGSVLSGNVADGIKITLKAGSAVSNNKAYGVKLTRDFSFYTFCGSMTATKPTTNTSYVDVAVNQMAFTTTFNKDAKCWQIWLKLKQSLKTKSGTVFYKLNVRINGKSVTLNASQDGDYLYIAIPEAILPGTAKTATLTIKAGAAAKANAGYDGIRFTADWSAYLFNGSWSDEKFDSVQETQLFFSGLQTAAYSNSAKRWDIYLRTNKEIPGTAWYNHYENFVYYYNGKKVICTANKSDSSNNKVFYLPLTVQDIGKIKDGDTLVIKAGTVTVSGGYQVTITKDFSLMYNDGIWSEYENSTVQAPKDIGSLWSVARFDKKYIPTTTDGSVLFSNEDMYNTINSTEKLKDFTISFNSKKYYDDETTPNIYMILRGNPVSESDPMTKSLLYGYVITLSSAQITKETNPNDPDLWGTWAGYVSLWKNGENYALLDQYRLSYVYSSNDHPFFKYNADYNYEVSIYNITDTTVCITLKVNGKLVMRTYDEASSDPLDPAVNAGTFAVGAGCPNYISDDIATLSSVIAAKDKCAIGEEVRVSATYPSVIDGVTYTIDKDGATITKGVFKATKAGSYTVTASYNGKKLGAKTITVTDSTKAVIANPAGMKLWQILLIVAGALIVLAGGAAAAILGIRSKKRAKKAKNS